MFDLEKSIADWRKQMRAAGIKTPVPLEELENHLREEIERQMKLGLDGQQAFKIASRRIGRSGELKVEFAKTCGFFDWLGDVKPTRINQILGMLWITQSTWFFIRFATSPVAVATILYFPHYWQSFTVLLTLLSFVGIIGSIRLFCGRKFGVNIIRIVAVLEFLLCATAYAGDKSFGDPNYWFGICSVFSIITIWLLRAPKHEEPKMAVK
jgi:hypothetical protein